MTTPLFHPSRRRLLQAGAASAALVGLSRKASAADDKILIGFWPIASGLPLYVGCRWKAPSSPAPSRWPRP